MIVLDPAEATILAVVAIVSAIVVMNRGNPYFINLKAQDEPLLVGIAVMLIAGFDEPIIRTAGVGVAGLAIASRYTSLFNIN